MRRQEATILPRSELRLRRVPMQRKAAATVLAVGKGPLT